MGSRARAQASRPPPAPGPGLSPRRARPSPPTVRAGARVARESLLDAGKGGEGHRIYEEGRAVVRLKSIADEFFYHVGMGNLNHNMFTMRLLKPLDGEGHDGSPWAFPGFMVFAGDGAPVGVHDVPIDVGYSWQAKLFALAISEASEIPLIADFVPVTFGQIQRPIVGCGRAQASAGAGPRGLGARDSDRAGRRPDTAGGGSGSGPDFGLGPGP